MPSKLHVAVVGYGIAGIAAAIELQKHNIRVSHFERRRDPGSTGAGMLLHPPAHAVLRRLGAFDTVRALGASVSKIESHTTGDRQIFSLDYGSVGDEHSAIGIQRAALHRALTEADSQREQLHAGVEICDLDTESGRLTDSLGNTYGPFDLAIVADGVHSAFRSCFEPDENRQRKSRSMALVGLLTPPVEFQQNSLQQIYDQDRHVSVWPVGSSQNDSPECLAFAISLRQGEPADHNQLITWMRRRLPLAGLRPDGAWKPENCHIFSYRDVTCRRWTNGRAVLIGDAAHAMSPLLGSGAQFAMEDGVLLAQTIADSNDPRIAIQSFARSRAQQLKRAQSISRRLTPIFMSESKFSSFLRDEILGRLANRAFMQRMARQTILQPSPLADIAT